MLLHDSSFLPSNEAINETFGATVTIAYSPLFHSSATLIISVVGLVFNIICAIKIWSIIYRYRQHKLNKDQHEQFETSVHVLSDRKYCFLFILASNDVVLCFASVISCIDEKFLFQSFLARFHLCSAHILLWKFTLHFIPLLTIFLLCRYHYMLSKRFQVRSSDPSACNQFLCTDLSILIPFVLAIAWSVDGLWLWGVAHIKDYIASDASVSEHIHTNESKEIAASSSVNQNAVNASLIDWGVSSIKSERSTQHHLYLMEQQNICYLQTNRNFHFTVRLLYLIQADFLLLCCLHTLAFILEITLYIRSCCYTLTRTITSVFHHERQISIYILSIFTMVTLTSLPFYVYRAIEIIFDIQLMSVAHSIINSRTLSQLLLFGVCFKPILLFILYCPPSMLFQIKVYLACHSSINFSSTKRKEKHHTSLSNNQDTLSQENQAVASQPQHCSLLMESVPHSKYYRKLRTQSVPTLTINHGGITSLTHSDRYNSWLQLTHSIINRDSDETTSIQFV